MSGLNVFLATAIRLTILLVASFRCVPDFVQGLTPGATLCFTQLALPEGGGPRQQVPHFVRPCENKGERVIAPFPLLIFGIASFSLHNIRWLLIVPCIFLIDWNEHMFANKPEE